MKFTSSLAHRVISLSKDNTSPFIVAICGWADTGKSTLAKLLCEELQQQGTSADWISTDAFLMDRNLRNKLGITGYNTASIDTDELMKATTQLSCGAPYEYFPYENRTGTRAAQSRSITPQEIVIIEGIHSLHIALLPQLQYKIFIDAPVDVMKFLRIKANMNKRGMAVQEASSRVDFELEEFRKYTAPGKRRADCVVNVTRAYDYTFASSVDHGRSVCAP